MCIHGVVVAARSHGLQHAGGLFCCHQLARMLDMPICRDFVCALWKLRSTVQYTDNMETVLCQMWLVLVHGRVWKTTGHIRKEERLSV